MTDLRSFIANSNEPVVITVRDPRDAVVSFMQRFPNSLATSFDEALKAIALSAHRLVELSRLREIPIFRYEDGFIGSVKTFDRIAALLSTNPPEDDRKAILAGLTPEAVKRTISGLEAAGVIRGEEVWDRETHWHANHVGDGTVGKFKSVLSPAQQREIVRQTREFCDCFGYDMTVDEMRKTEAPLTAPNDAVPIAAAETKQPAPDQGQAMATQRRDAGMKTIGLCMIVKNEAKVIRRCLDSVRPLLDYVLVEDTGSTDGTQEIIRDWLTQTGLPGEVFDEPWQDFAHNRTLALARLRENSAIDYALIMDADDIMEYEPDFDPNRFKDGLSADHYHVAIRLGGTKYARAQICSNRKAYRYRGVLHEFIEGPEESLTSDTAQGLLIVAGVEGARSADPEKYRRDAAVLERALQTETDAFMRSRYTFYLAQSCRDAGDTEKAIEQYLLRADLGFWDEEIYCALYQAARLQAHAKRPADEVLATYQRAIDVMPRRAEATHGASHYCRLNGRNEEGYQIAARGLALTEAPPPAGLFIESWIYEYGLLDEYAINAYWSGHYRECLDASLRILSHPNCPEGQRQRILANAKFAAGNLPPPHAPNLGSLGEESFVKQHMLVPPRLLRPHLVGTPRVLVAILAKQKEPSLPLYLECIEALHYPKSSIVLYIRTNNNTDGTERILREWVARVGHLYAAVEFDAEDVAARVEQFGVHEWNATRFSVLGRIRNISLRRALEQDCDFYFVSDVDNFIRPSTLRELMALNLPIVAPLLRAISPGGFYSNYHAEIDANGYYKGCDQYHWVLNRWIRGVLEMPVVHCTYLIRADVLNDLTYEDATNRHEYVVFSDSARKSGVPQYLDNRQIYGYITFDEGDSHHVADGIAQARSLLNADLSARASIEDQTWDSKPALVSPAAGPQSDAPARRAIRPKTLIFCTSFAKTREEWDGRYRRWLQAIRSSQLEYDNILIVDDGSPVLPDWTDVTIGTGEIGETPPAELLLYHFRENLGRKALFDFPGWYRSFAFAGRYAHAHGFEKVIHIESDAFLIGSRIQRYFNDATTGWTALWCGGWGYPQWGLPESAIQVIAGGAVRRFAEIERTHPHESLIGREFELQLPFDVVERRFVGNRYGQYLPFVPGNAEYAVQVRSGQSDDYYWWLLPGYRDSRVEDAAKPMVPEPMVPEPQGKRFIRLKELPPSSEISNTPPDPYEPSLESKDNGLPDENSVECCAEGPGLEGRITLLVHQNMAEILASLVLMFADGLRELSMEPEVIHELPPGFVGRAIVLGGNFFSMAELECLGPDSIIFNIENTTLQFLTDEYRQLLRKFSVWDFSKSNAASLAETLARPVYYFRTFYVERLTRITDAAEQDIDVLFYGSTNARRSEILNGLRARGLRVEAAFGVFGAQLDQLIARSKVIINIHFYDNGRLEMIRLFDLLANGRAVVSEVNPGELVDADLADAFVAAPYERLVEETEALVHDPDRRRNVAMAGFRAFSHRHPNTILREALAWSEAPMPPSDAVIGSGKMYDPKLFNIDMDERWYPDIVADIADRQLFAREFSSRRFGKLRLQRGWFNSITASHVLEHLPDLVTAMTNCLELLADGGLFRIAVPYDLSYGAWQDPTHVRGFNERSWLYYCEWYWYLGWTESRFDLIEQSFRNSPWGDTLAARGVPQDEIPHSPRAVDEMHVVLRKRRLTEAERAYGQEMRGDTRATIPVRQADNTPLALSLKATPSAIHEDFAALEEIYLINLDRSTDRLAKFNERNSHLKNVLRISAIDGALVDREELVKDGTITEDLSYTPGALGCALSHVGLWKKATSQNRIVTIFEDDVICSRNFLEESARVVSSLPADWDIIQWGYVFDPLFVWVDFGFSKAELRFYDRRFSRDYRKFQSENLSPAAIRLVHSFGTQAYSVSPKGARVLLESCLPLRKGPIPFPGTAIVNGDNAGIDMAMCAAYGSMQAFICIPPLAIQDDTQTSDVSGVAAPCCSARAV